MLEAIDRASFRYIIGRSLTVSVAKDREFFSGYGMIACTSLEYGLSFPLESTEVVT